MSEAALEDEHQELIDEIGSMIGPCPICGAGVTKDDFSLKVCREIMTIDMRLEEEHPRTRNGVLGWNYMCDECTQAMERKTEQARLNEIHGQMLRYTYNVGLMPDFAKLIEWCESKHEHFKHNAEVYRMFEAGLEDTNYWVNGPVGTGKTWLCIMALNAKLEANFSVAMVSAPEFCRQAEAWSETRTKYFTKIRDVSWLFIDDIDKANYTERTMQLLWELVNYRWANKKRMLITANVPGAQVYAQWESRGANATMAKSMMDRFLPIKRVDLVGDSLRG